MEKSWNWIDVCEVMMPKGGTRKRYERLFKEAHARISWRSCLQVLESFSMELWQSLRLERDMLTVCGVRARKENICWRSSRGRARRGGDMLEMLSKSKLLLPTEQRMRILSADIYRAIKRRVSFARRRSTREKKPRQF